MSLPNSWPTETEIINACYFKSLHPRVICCKAVSKEYRMRLHLVCALLTAPCESRWGCRSYRGVCRSAEDNKACGKGACAKLTVPPGPVSGPRKDPGLQIPSASEPPSTDQPKEGHVLSKAARWTTLSSLSCLWSLPTITFSATQHAKKNLIGKAHIFLTSICKAEKEALCKHSKKIYIPPKSSSLGLFQNQI